MDWDKGLNDRLPHPFFLFIYDAWINNRASVISTYSRLQHRTQKMSEMSSIECLPVLCKVAVVNVTGKGYSHAQLMAIFSGQKEKQSSYCTLASVVLRRAQRDRPSRLRQAGDTD
jgi:hypothetical protein